MENAENGLIYQEPSSGYDKPFQGRMYYCDRSCLIRDHGGKLIDIEKNNCKLLTELLVANILAPVEEFDLDEDEYYDLTYLIIEDDLIPALINGESIFLNSI